jgi:phosphatidyl-myo-inositol dimannoside synthase
MQASIVIPRGEDQALTEKNSIADERTRVLLLTDSFLPHAGGSREYYNNIYRKLVDLGDSEVTILTKKIPGWEEFDRVASTEFFQIKRRYRPLGSWKYKELPKGLGPFVDAAWHAVRYSPAIIHAGDLYPPGVTAMILKKLFGLPYVVYCHGEEIPQLDRFKYQPLIRNRIYLNADTVIAASEFTRNNLMKLGVPEGRICKIVPGVNSTRFRPMARRADLIERYGLQGKTIILTVARLVPRKGHQAAIEAFAKVCNEFPEAHYLIVGRGQEEPRLRQMVLDAGLNERVTFAGYVAAEQLPDIYNLCDIMLMANRQEEDGDVEGFGIVFLEANAVGKPVIGGRTGGAAEAIADGATGFLVNPDDPQEIAGIMRRLLGDPGLREKLGTAGVRRVRSDFSWEARAKILSRVNLEILGRNGSKAECEAKGSMAVKQAVVGEIFQPQEESHAAEETKEREKDLISVPTVGEHRLSSTETSGRA